MDRQDQLDRDLSDADRLDALLDSVTGTATGGYHGLTYRRDVEPSDTAVARPVIPELDYWEEPGYSGGVDPVTRRWEEEAAAHRERDRQLGWYPETRIEEMLTRFAEAFREWIDGGCKMEDEING